jgi:hypothetical protein
MAEVQYAEEYRRIVTQHLEKQVTGLLPEDFQMLVGHRYMPGVPGALQPHKPVNFTDATWWQTYNQTTVSIITPQLW